MSWDYRIVRYRNKKGFGLHEIYYDKKGNPESMTERAVGFACDVDEGPQGVIKSLQMALEDAVRNPIFDEPKEWPKPKWPRPKNAT